MLGLWLYHGPTAVRIVEVEAYEPDDPASHSFIGPRPRTKSMFGPPGHLYVYRSYGIHWCANVVCSRPGVGSAVLLRAGEPITGEALMAERRSPMMATRMLCSGPGKLCAALAIGATHDGVDLCGRGSALRLVAPAGVDTARGPAGWAPGHRDVVVTRRIGISKAVDRPWRWLVASSPHVSPRTPRG